MASTMGNSVNILSSHSVSNLAASCGIGSCGILNEVDYCLDIQLGFLLDEDHFSKGINI